MGLLDLAAPVFTWLDGALAAIMPALGRLIFWGLLAGVISMAVYAILSPQQRLRRVRDEALEARRALDRHDGSFVEARPLIARMFATSMKQLALVLAPAILASLPLLFVLAWLHGTFGYVVPETAAEVRLTTEPRGYKTAVRQEVVESESGLQVQGAKMLLVQDGRGRVVVERRLDAAVTSLHKKQWWNTLLANPLGYLPNDSPIERVSIELPRQEVLPFGPWWMRGWEFVFFTTLVAVSLALKLLFKLV